VLSSSAKVNGVNSGVRIIVALVVVAIVVILIFVTGWADDRARPGSTGRGKVTRSVTP
jgi:hypothetical protein